MTEFAHKALLPDGLHDDLPPDAEFEAAVIERLLASFASYGYQRVKPPLIEFEESLLAGPGSAVAPHMFRLMDPVSQRMLGVRVDITAQVARIASTRLGRVPRPLRLSYAGQVLRTRGSQLRPERQFAQAGVELVGAAGVDAEAEVAQLAVEALVGLGVRELSVDFCLPTLVGTLCRAFDFDADTTERARAALDRKDAAAVAAIPEPGGALMAALLAAAGPARRALAAIEALELPEAAVAMCADLAELVRRVDEASPEAAITVDPVEFRGFAYESGVSFTLFAKGVRGELGRGGSYHLDGGEPAVGVTIYLDSLVRALPERRRAPCVYIPLAAPAAEGRRLRGEGWRTLRGLEAEARRLGCNHLLADGEIVELA